MADYLSASPVRLRKHIHMIGECRFCDRKRSLIDAHIIPEGFFRQLGRFGGVNRLLHGTEYPKKARIGVYDQNFLCAECDNVFSPWEEYAQTLLDANLTHFEAVPSTGKPIAFVCRRFDYAKLKLFFISLLWRASISTQPFFEKVDLGPYEARAKALLKSKDSGDPNEFAVVLRKFDHEVGEAILSPVSVRINGIRSYQFFFGGYIAHIKVSGEQFLYPLSEVIVHPDKPLVVLSKKLRGSRELDEIQRIIGAPQNLLKA